MNAADLIPCATCPWRVDKDATTIPRYNHDKACGLVRTVGAEDGLRPIMACHHSSEDDAPLQRTCRGYLVQAGWSNINVRILMARGELPYMDVLESANAGIELEPDYETVLAKLARSVGEESDCGAG